MSPEPCVSSGLASSILSSAMPADAAATLKPLADKAKAAGSKVKVSGYHDATGDLAANQELAKQRAIATIWCRPRSRARGP